MFQEASSLINYYFGRWPLATIITGIVMVSLCGGGLLICLCRCCCCPPRKKPKAKEIMTNAFPGRVNKAPFYFPGLVNSGNSCYLNSVLQSLAAIYPSLPPCPRDSLMARTLYETLARLNTAHRSKTLLRTEGLVAAMSGGLALNDTQQDAHEFLQALLSVLGRHLSKRELSLTYESLNAPKLAPWEAMVASSVLCTGGCARRACHTQTVATSIISVLPAPTLEQAILSSMSPDPLADYHCPRCDRQTPAWRMSTVVRWPPVLIIHVQRLSIDRSGILFKDNERMLFPATMMAPAEESLLSPLQKELPSQRPYYQLQALIQHHGGTSSGHYTAYRRVSLVDQQEGSWLHCSDSTVVSCSLERVLTEAAPYILLYSTGC